ncbi:MAG: S8/S53 family peptidase [Polyangiales bacterium]
MKVLDHPAVEDAFPDWYELQSDWNLQQYRDQTFLQEFHDANYQGGSGTRSTTTPSDDRIRIAIIEAKLSPQTDVVNDFVFTGPNQINSSHVNWLGAGSPLTRLTAELFCPEDDECEPEDFPSSNATHGTTVASIAAGGAVVFTSFRAGILPRALIRYYRTEQITNIKEALEQAMIWGADVANVSIGVPCGLPFGTCGNQLNCGDLNPLLATVMDMGMVVAWSAGNYQNDPNWPTFKVPDNYDCNVQYPAFRPEVISVGGAGDTDTTSSFSNAALGRYSGRGFLKADRGGSLGGRFDMAAVSVVAPGVIGGQMTEGVNTFGDNSAGRVWSIPQEGNSFSTPVVAGAAGLFREWMDTHAPANKDSVPHIRAMITAMGSGLGARTVGGDLRSGVGRFWGAGKFFAHPVNQLPGGGFRQSADWVIEGWTTTAMQLPALPSSTKVLKIGAFIKVHDLTQVPHIFMLVKDACDGMRLLGHDLNFGVEKFIRIEAPSAGGGICPVVEYYGLSVSWVPTAYTFAYWTNDPNYANEH